MKHGNRHWRTHNARRLLREIRRADAEGKAEAVQFAEPTVLDRAIALAQKRRRRRVEADLKPERVPERIRLPEEMLSVSITRPRKRRFRLFDPRTWF
jgi:hypothetical protein